MHNKEKLTVYKARLADFLLPLIFAAIVVFSFISLTSAIKSRERALCEGSAVHAASHVSISIGSVVRSGVRMASAIQSNPSLSLRELSGLASSILDLGNFVTGVSVAPNAVVKYHFPESGDQSSIGHDLLSNPERRDTLARAMETGQPVLSGPEESMEGGQVVFIRFPVFQANKIWGFVNVTVDFGSLISGFTDPGEFPGISFAFAIRDEDSGQGTWSLASGAKAAYDARGVFAPVLLPGTEWHIYAMPDRGWSSASPYIYVLLVAGLMAAVLLFLTLSRHRTSPIDVGHKSPQTVPVKAPQPRPDPIIQDKPLPTPPVEPVREERKNKKEVHFKGQKVKGELYMPDVLLSGDPESLFRMPEASPVVDAPIPVTPTPAPSKVKDVPSKQVPLFTMDEDLVKAKPSILVVDDSEANRDIMGRMLSLRGYSADFASSGEEALVKAGSGSYDIVFMDCFMPVMDGYQASKALRSRFPGSTMKIVGISARIGDQEAARCSQAGMDALLAKPFTLKELQATLEKHS